MSDENIRKRAGSPLWGWLTEEFDYVGHDGIPHTMGTKVMYPIISLMIDMNGSVHSMVMQASASEGVIIEAKCIVISEFSMN